jgi:hypothetical protein
MSAKPFRFEAYDWHGGRELMLVRGDSEDRHVLLLPPLFEEMNFTRTLLAEVGRTLAAQGVTSWLPDLPGSGESVQELCTIRWDDWQSATAAIVATITRISGRPPVSCAFRGGALLDSGVGAAARWRYAPASGEGLLRQMRRAQLVTDHEAARDAREESEVVLLAGYALSRAMRDGLAAAVPAEGAERTVESIGTPLWRRAEPARDDALARELANDIGAFLTACAAR